MGMPKGQPRLTYNRMSGSFGTRLPCLVHGRVVLVDHRLVAVATVRVQGFRQERLGGGNVCLERAVLAAVRVLRRSSGKQAAAAHLVASGRGAALCVFSAVSAARLPLAGPSTDASSPAVRACVPGAQHLGRGKTHRSAAFYLAPSRAWELLLGALLAAGTVPPVRRPALREVLPLFGLALIAWSASTFSDETPFPWLSALLPCVGAALIIYAGQHRSTVTKETRSRRRRPRPCSASPSSPPSCPGDTSNSHSANGSWRRGGSGCSPAPPW